MKYTKRGVILCVAMLLSISFPIESNAQLWPWGKKKAKTEKSGKSDKKKGKIKPYGKVITKDAVTSEGLFTVHQVDDKWYFEVENDLLEKELLVVSRISGFVKGLNFGGAGVKSRPQQVVRLQRKDNKVLLRSVSYNSVADSKNPIYLSVKNNNFEPVVMAFDIAAEKDSTGLVFDVSKLFTSDVAMIGAVSDREKKRFGIRGVDGSRSYVNGVKAFPKNVNVKHVLTSTRRAYDAKVVR